MGRCFHWQPPCFQPAVQLHSSNLRPLCTLCLLSAASQLVALLGGAGLEASKKMTLEQAKPGEPRRARPSAACYAAGRLLLAIARATDLAAQRCSQLQALAAPCPRELRRC